MGQIALDRNMWDSSHANSQDGACWKPHSDPCGHSRGMQASSDRAPGKSRENTRPWFKFYTRDFRDGVRVLSLEEIGAYTLVLSLLYETGGRLKDDERVICAQLGCDVRVWRRVRARLLQEGKFTATDDGFLTNERATKEITSAELLSEIRRTSGRSGGQQSGKSRAKTLGDKETHEANASVLLDTEGRGQRADTTKVSTLVVSELTLTPDEPEASTRRKPRVGATERTLPAELSPGMRKAADKAGYLNGTGDAQFELWRDWHLARGSLIADFDASFRTWIANAQRFDAQRSPKASHDNRTHASAAGDAGAASRSGAQRSGSGASQPRCVGIEYTRRLYEAEQRQAANSDET